MRWQFTRFLAVSLFFLAVAHPAVFAQGPQGVQWSVKKDRGSIADPVRLITIYYDGKPIRSQVPFPPPTTG
jgi:hypothetical protein